MRSLTFPRTISIHALREEGDAPPSFFGYDGGYFYPRPPRGGRPSINLQAKSYAAISIHALREEGDATLKGKLFDGADFYPRPPRGGRPGQRRGIFCFLNFYPRPPRGGRPAGQLHRVGQRRISIHALREEGDHDTAAAVDQERIFLSTPSARRATQHNFRVAVPRMDFYPRPPRGGRRRGPRRHHRGERISIHALREEGDPAPSLPRNSRSTFLSTPSARRATAADGCRQHQTAISIHALREEGDSKNRDKISIFL